MRTLVTVTYFTVAGLGCVWGAMQGYVANATSLLVVGAMVYLCIAALLMLAFSYEDVKAGEAQEE